MKTGNYKLAWTVLVLVGATITAGLAVACPFCDAPAQTLSEETASADAVILAQLATQSEPVADPNDPNSGTATFRIVDVLRGKDRLEGVKEINAVYFGEADTERVFLISGLGTEQLDWTTPLPLSKAGEAYVRALPTVPASGADRLAFFQQYLENDDPLLAQDAYDEFARAPYEEVIALGPRMNHDQLVKWIADFEINPSRRRLYLTMLGVCGGNDDLPLLEAMIRSDFNTMEPQLQQIVATGMAMNGPVCLPTWIEIVQQHERQKKLGLDALVACYLTLRGPDGLDLIDERFLKDPKVDYTYIYSTIMALRFHGDQDTGVLPRERLLGSMRLLLDNTDFADQVILDLSRWEDWSVMDRLIEMFENADEKGYVRQPVVTYLTVASEQPGDVGKRAAAGLAELESIDPETVKQARSLMAFGALARAKPETDTTSADSRPTDAAVARETQAFAASAEDNETDPAEIPDPAEYEEGEEPAVTVESPPATAHVAASASAPAAKSEVTVSKIPATQAAASTAEVASQPRPLLIIGVPLAAAVLLIGVYWLILRAGAV